MKQYESHETVTVKLSEKKNGHDTFSGFVTHYSLMKVNER